MKTEEIESTMDPDLKALMQAACDRLANGVPFTKQERERAAAEIARIRQENAKIFGIQNVVVDAVRESQRLTLQKLCVFATTTGRGFMN